MNLRRLLLSLCALALGACQTSVVRHLPEAAVADCPAALQGAWRSRAGGGQDDFGVLIAADCSIHLLGGCDPLAEEKIITAARYWQRADITLLFLPMASVRAADDVPLEESLRDTHLVVRWTAEDAGAVVDFPDHRRLATLIVNGAVNGATQWSGSTGENIVESDAAALTDLLWEPLFFNTEDRRWLQPFAGSREALAAALQASAAEACQVGPPAAMERDDD
jgi:hypothetical protein